MIMSEIQSTIRNLVAQNKLESALDELIKWSVAHQDSELQNNIIVLKSRYERVKQQERIGVLNYTDALKEQAFTASSIMDIIQKLDDQSSEESGNKDIAPDPSRKTILFLASSPKNLAKLQLDKEFVRISSSLQEGITEYKLVAEWAITPNALQHAILKHKPHLIHFSGHGTEDSPFGNGIILNDAEGNPKLVSGVALENLFRIFSRKLNIEIILLNSCYSEEQAKGISKHIPYVIGMNNKIDDDSAIEFSTGFYRGLAEEEEDIEFAFDLAVNMIQLEGALGEGTPVLLKKDQN